MLRRKLTVAFLFYAFLLPTVAFGQTKNYSAPKDVIDKIKDEGMNRSQVMQHLSYLTNVIGPRLTNSPNQKRASEWARDTMTKWGLQNSHLEEWGPFGRGWTLKNFSAQIVEPQTIALIAYPKAWSPGTDTLGQKAFTGEIVYLDAKDEADLQKYKGQLKGKIVLITAPRETKALFDAPGRRFSDSDLQTMANAPATRPQPNQNQGANQFNQRKVKFVYDEGASIIVDTSAKGDGGTLFVQQVVVPQDPNQNPPIRYYDKDAKIPVQISVATEQYNRLVEMTKQGLKPKMTVDLQVEFQDKDMMSYNTIAEIPGTDPKLKDEIVMLGAHLDSWHSASGATDNAAGSASMMEAVRIIQTLGLKPRRTIRIALWSAEEQGLLGSRAYVKKHFGQLGDGTAQAAQAALRGEKQEFTKQADYEKLSGYFNMDNGTGRIRGVYMQGNEGIRPIFQQWLLPFEDIGAKTLTLNNTGSTDHVPFDTIGLPGFQFIQDPVEYSTRSHHSNMDLYERIQADDLKQASTIIAAFVYQTAMLDEKLPRKPMQ